MLNSDDEISTDINARYQAVVMETWEWPEDVLSFKKFVLMGKSLALYFKDEFTQVGTLSKSRPLIEFRRNYLLCEPYNEARQPNPSRQKKKKAVQWVQGMKMSYLFIVHQIFCLYKIYKFSTLNITDVGLHVSNTFIFRC
jgi:hypothetical protein